MLLDSFLSFLTLFLNKCKARKGCFFLKKHVTSPILAPEFLISPLSWFIQRNVRENTTCPSLAFFEKHRTAYKTKKNEAFWLHDVHDTSRNQKASILDTRARF